jgi:hypothetical protein
VNDREYIKSQLTEEEILTQLAEEAAELSQAALKMRRAMTNCNPTPKSREECALELTKEVGDVWVCLELLDGILRPVMEKEVDMGLHIEVRMTRWARRLRDR